MIGHYWLIILIAVACGWAGGYRNYLSLVPDKRDITAFARMTIEATAAAMIVPLFLSAIGNDITDTVLDGSAGMAAWLYAILKLTGFCILASLYSRNFLDNVSDKLLRLEAKVDEEEKSRKRVSAELQEIKPLVRNIDHLIVEESLNNVANTRAAVDDVKLSDKQYVVVNAFASSSVPARTMDGLSLATDIEEGELGALLDELINLAIVERLDTHRGPRWALTAKGRAIADKRVRTSIR